MSELSSILDKIKELKGVLKIEELKEKMIQLGEEMNQADFWSDQSRATAVTKDYEDIKKEILKIEGLEKRAKDVLILKKSADDQLAQEIDEETKKIEEELSDYEFLLLMNGPYDKNNATIAIHAGSGGTEAQDWAEMLFRMLSRFAEKMNWQVKVLSESRGAEAGYKSILFSVTGRYAYGYLKSEHGVHRLVRISPFDAEKMRHTSFALVEVLPEIDDTIEVKLDPKDLRIDTFQSSGAGGQSVNTTYSAVRVVHEPTGISVSCQNERSQAQNKETALKVLRAKLHQLAEQEKKEERQELRGEYKSAEWGNQIRSYVLHPYHMVKDHRSGYESKEPEKVLEGELKDLTESYLKWIKNPL